MDKEELWKCTICGSIGTVGRCCGMETRIRYIPPVAKKVIKCEFCGKVRNGTSERIRCIALTFLLALTIFASFNLIIAILGYVE